MMAIRMSGEGTRRSLADRASEFLAQRGDRARDRFIGLFVGDRRVVALHRYAHREALVERVDLRTTVLVEDAHAHAERPDRFRHDVAQAFGVDVEGEHDGQIAVGRWETGWRMIDRG